MLVDGARPVQGAPRPVLPGEASPAGHARPRRTDQTISREVVTGTGFTRTSRTGEVSCT